MKKVENDQNEYIIKCVQDGHFKELQEYLSTHSDAIVWSDCIQVKSKDTCLHIASRKGYVEILRYLLEAGAGTCLELGNKDGKRPLHEAAHFSQLECLQTLIESGCDVNALKRADWTPLMLACTRSDVTVVTSLLAAGALPLLTNKDGWTAAQIASRAGEAELLHLLLKTAPQLKDMRSKTGRTLLHTAAFAGHVHIVRSLAERHQLAVDATDSSLTTPLMDACRAGHRAAVEYLLDRGADLRRGDLLGRQALHAAAQAGQVEIVSLLAERIYLAEEGGVPAEWEEDRGGSDADGNFSQDASASSGGEPVSRDRSEETRPAGSRLGVNAPAADGSTALHSAAREGHGQVCELLVGCGANRGVRDGHGRTAAQVAAIHKHRRLAERLQG